VGSDKTKGGGVKGNRSANYYVQWNGIIEWGAIAEGGKFSIGGKRGECRKKKKKQNQFNWRGQSKTKCFSARHLREKGLAGLKKRKELRRGKGMAKAFQLKKRESSLGKKIRSLRAKNGEEGEGTLRRKGGLLKKEKFQAWGQLEGKLKPPWYCYDLRKACEGVSIYVLGKANIICI